MGGRERVAHRHHDSPDLLVAMVVLEEVGREGV